ncbi:MAG: hypothetical protein LBQ91_03435, partial [Oscillospiraceae bacterium]|nr:hypothetical protein [Oscillospiraceae bacterium]
KRSRPFLVTFSGEPEKVTARRVGALAVSRKAAESLFQTPHPLRTENFSFPPLVLRSKEHPRAPQIHTKKSKRTRRQQALSVNKHNTTATRPHNPPQNRRTPQKFPLALFFLLCYNAYSYDINP